MSFELWTHGHGELTTSGSATDDVMDGSVEVTIPLFGKKIEKAVAERLQELLTNEAEFTGAWIANH